MRGLQAAALVVLWLCASGEPLRAQAPKASPPADPVRVGGSVKAPARVKNVAPVYPAKARENHIQGIVILDITVGVDGAVTEVKVLRAIQELNDAAIEAVKQWRYEPTKIDGVLVPIRMSVSINFTIR
jgi:periplasmic protein TonB